MLSKIVIGTANFNKPYGVLSNGCSLPINEIQKVIEIALENHITSFDTAFSYGNIFDVIPSKFVNKVKITTKFSLLEDYNLVLEKLECQQKQGFIDYDALLVHDPHHLKTIHQNKLKDFFWRLKDRFSHLKIGVSVYEVSELETFDTIYTPEIIQVPLNPLNQKFDCKNFLSYIDTHKIDVQARSLFLQGLLLQKQLPSYLTPLQSHWSLFQKRSAHYSSILQALLVWAHTRKWVNQWVLGVSSARDLQEIIQNASPIDTLSEDQSFETFKGMEHPLVDPRHWTVI